MFNYFIIGLLSFACLSLQGFSSDNHSVRKNLKHAATQIWQLDSNQISYVRHKLENNIVVHEFRPRHMKKNNKLPSVTYFHGGPHLKFTPELRLLPQKFCEAGYIFFAPEISGSAENEALKNNQLFDYDWLND